MLFILYDIKYMEYREVFMAEMTQSDFMEKMTFEIALEEWRQCGQRIYQFRAYLGKGETSPGVCNIVHLQGSKRKKSGYVN